MLLKVIIGVLSGFFGAIGVGGGSVLLIYLTLFTGMEITKARTVNLLFFIPCAFVGLLFHIKNKLIVWKQVLPLVFFGLAGVIAGFYCNQFISPAFLKKIFGAFIIVLALFQIISVFKEKKEA